MSEIENVVIFVVDALRWDSLPTEVESKGIVRKTIAQSLYTVPSFSSIATGLYPQEHGANGWGERISSDVDTIFDLDGYDTGFYQEVPPNKDAVYSVLRQTEQTPLSDLEPPFVYMERDLSPHMPLLSYSDTQQYFKQKKNNWSEIERDYNKAVAESVSTFEDRLDYLESEGILDKTLVVFTSDHGELLGEHGCALHSSPAVPELVYVPTVFIHPSLDSSYLNTGEVIEHVDITSTVTGNLKGTNFETSGTDILNSSRDRNWGYNHIRINRGGRTFYDADSLWTEDGGYVRVNNSLILRSLYVLNEVFRAPSRFATRSDFIKMFRTYSRQSTQFGQLNRPNSELNELIDNFIENLSKHSADEGEELDSEIKDHLSDLGYVDT
ncbi:hypothetical protein C5B86_04015 [Haloferax sp. Atlit-19N]|uniref:sulfatase-like hydrolase/transferase n=1 Tax=Haloferax sp. Atlit-19N TaxID=2077201 RepID=UPI000E263D41|nr:sulfatase-like hydrolase/transferase [Haloferax sp. Atlit-19N]RDZ48222.1 hypothetical protein C5B86_04015 [Haloferax sp. Atlit-19N]